MFSDRWGERGGEGIEKKENVTDPQNTEIDTQTHLRRKKTLELS